MKLSHLTHIECKNVWKTMFSRARARIFLTTLAPPLADASKSDLLSTGYLFTTASTLLMMHPNPIYPQPETYSQPPLPSCRCILIRFTLNRKLIHPLADAFKSDLPSTGNMLTFTSLAQHPPFRITTILPTPCIVPCFNRS